MAKIANPQPESLVPAANNEGRTQDPPQDLPLLAGSLPCNPAICAEHCSQRIGYALVSTQATPGTFYCGHMFYATQKAAGMPGASVVRDPQGNTAVGFIHTPCDPYAGSGPPYDQQQRQAPTQQIVGAALRGYFAVIAAAEGTQGPVKVMLNGFGTFRDVADNPTGQFVSNRTNLDGAMRNAFGDRLLTGEGERVHNSASASAGTTYRYLVRDPTTAGPREVHLHATAFPVEDCAINGLPGSVQDLMAQFRPHAVLSLGYQGSAACYMAEHYASNAELAAASAGFKRNIGAPATEIGYNYSLINALSGFEKRSSAAAVGKAGVGAVKAVL